MSVGVIEAGAWGTAIAQMLASDGRDVLLWAREPEVVDGINAERRNALYLPSARLHSGIRATGNLGELASLSTVFVVTPAQHLGSTLADLGAVPTDLVLCSKGIERGTGRLMNDVAASACPGSALAIMSGPTFAPEVAAGLPPAVTLACADGRVQWARLSPVIARPAVRPEG